MSHRLVSLRFARLIAAVAALAVAVPFAAGASGPQTTQAYFQIDYVASPCPKGHCSTPAAGAVVTAFNAAGTRLLTLVANAKGRTRIASFPPERVLIVVRPKSYRGKHWAPLKFHARAPWTGTTALEFSLKFCLASGVSC